MYATDSSPFALEMLNAIPSLSARARRLCQNQADAQDLVQETLARALSHVSQFELGTNLRAWLQQILFHLFVSRRRRTIREHVGLARWAAERPIHDHCVDGTLNQMKMSPRLEDALDELPEKIAVVVRRVDIEEQSYREVAEQMRIPIGTVMSRLFRGRRRLAQAVADEMLPAPAQAA
jgi:RNA polymerase sigma-70 factor (ECF subfamily)